MDNAQDRLIEALRGVLDQQKRKDMSADFQDMFAVSQYLNEHPVKSESVDYKIKYLSVLEYFVKSYAANSLYAAAALHNYKDCLLGDDFQSYDYACKDVSSRTKWLARTRFRGFRLFSNRFILAMDIIFLCAFDDANKGHANRSFMQLIQEHTVNASNELALSISQCFMKVFTTDHPDQINIYAAWQDAIKKHKEAIV